MSRLSCIWLAPLLWLSCASPTPPPTTFPVQPVAPSSPTSPVLEPAQHWAAASQIFEQRCVVCHGCYDAPCQLQLGSFEGIERGASKVQVYDGTRLLANDPTRLFIDAQGTKAWRARDFIAVLPEGKVSDARASLLVRASAV